MVRVNGIDIFSKKCPRCFGSVAFFVVDDIVKHVECDDCDYILKEDEYK